MTSSQLSVSIDHVAYQAPKGDGCKRCRLLTARPQDERGTLNDLGGSRDDNKRGRKLSESVPRPGQGGETHTYTLVRPSCISPKCDDMWEVGHTHTHLCWKRSLRTSQEASRQWAGRPNSRCPTQPNTVPATFFLGKGAALGGRGWEGQARTREGPGPAQLGQYRAAAAGEGTAVGEYTSQPKPRSRPEVGDLSCRHPPALSSCVAAGRSLCP